MCNNESDTKGISHLTNQDFFLKSACIRKYYNAEENKYYDTSDENFRWPAMAHGTYHPKTQFYAIFLERCHEETVGLVLGEGSHCKTPEEINQVVSMPSSTHLFYIDHYVDSLNYKNPNTKFFNRIENSFSRENILTNNINLDPILVKTHNGLVFDNEKEDNAYTYERNDVLTYDIFDSGFYTIYYFWLSNRQNYYERKYKRIQDIISEIGGINQFITIVASYINFLFNDFIVLSDTQKLLFSSIDTVKNGDKKHKKEIAKPNILVKSDKLEKHNKLKNIKNNSLRNDKKINNKNSEKSINKNDKNNICPKNISNNDNENNTRSLINLIQEKYSKNSKQKINYDNMKINNFFSYLIFKLSFEKKNVHHKIFKDFRIKMLSEKHLMKNHLNVYNLLKVHEHKKNFRRKSYHLKDLINLI